MGKPWLPVEDNALKALVKERTGDELAPVAPGDSAWADLVTRWMALGKVKGFRTNRSFEAMYKRHLRFRRKAGREDSCPNGGDRNPWSAEEEKALLGFVKERKGNEMAALCGEVFFKDLEKAWQSKGFDTARTANAMYEKHNRMREKRAEQPATTPLPSSTSSTTSATAQAPSLSSSGRKRSPSAAALAPSSSTAAKKTKISSSYNPSPYTASYLPPPVNTAVSVLDPDSDSDSDSDSGTGAREYSRWLRANGLQ